MKYEQERAVAIEAVLQASQLCRAVQRSLTAEDKLTKPDRSPVTVADFGSQALIVSHLLQAFPGDPIVGEEDAAALRQPEQSALKANVIRRVQAVAPHLSEPQILDAIDHGAQTCDFTQRYWTLDPIDGTKGFLRGEHYAIALALIENGEVVLGVLGCPNLPLAGGVAIDEQGCLLAAVKGQGAFMRSFADASERRIQIAPTAQPAAALFCESVESGHAAHDVHAQITALLGITAPPLRLDGQNKYALVARGDVALYLHLTTKPDYRSWIWDHAAGAIIVQEAGGLVTDRHGKPFDFAVGRKLRENVGIVVTNGKLHRAVLAAVQQVFAE